MESENMKLYNQVYFQQHKKERLEYNRRWCSEHADHKREYQREYMRRYRKNMTEEQKEKSRMAARLRYRKKHWLNEN